MTTELIVISLLYILIWLESITLIKGIIEKSISKYSKLYSVTIVSIAIISIVIISRS